MTTFLWILLAAFCLLPSAYCLLLLRRVRKGLRDLTTGTEKIAAGAYGQKIYVDGPAILGELARSFNHMSTCLDTRIRQPEEDRQQLRMILSGMVEGVLALDAEQNILFVNERAEQLLSLPAQTAAGRKLWEVVRRPPFQDIVKHALTRPEPHVEEVSWPGTRTQTLTVHAARLPGIPPRGAILVLHDTTELRRLERVRQEFVANVSHELKTPLSVISACIETLLDGAVEDPAHRGPFLERIAEQAHRLHMLILDLLSLARIESGTEAFELKAVPLEPLIAACIEKHRALAESRKQTLRSHSWPSAPSACVAWGDEEAIGQILDNLVDNALKYTPEGGQVEIGCHRDGEELCVEVRDTGIGIPEKDLPRIFERFYRVDRARSREMGGTGLGLSIVKHLAQALRGSVEARSKLGAGTVFEVRLPIARLD